MIELYRRFEIDKTNIKFYTEKFGKKLKLGDVIITLKENNRFTELDKDTLKRKMKAGLKVKGLKLSSDGRLISDHAKSLGDKIKEQILIGASIINSGYADDYDEEIFISRNAIGDEYEFKQQLIRETQSKSDLGEWYYLLDNYTDRAVAEIEQQGKKVFDVYVHMYDQVTRITGCDYKEVIKNTVEEIDLRYEGYKDIDLIEIETEGIEVCERVEPFVLLSRSNKSANYDAIKLDQYNRSKMTEHLYCDLNENMEKLLNIIRERANKEHRDYIYIQENINALLTCDMSPYKIDEPQDTLKRVITNMKKTGQGEYESQSVQEYLDLIACIQLLYNKKNGSVKYDDNNKNWIIEKLGVTLDVYPFEVDVKLLKG